MHRLPRRSAALAVLAAAMLAASACVAIAQRFDAARYLARADLDGDGRITGPEFDQARATFFDRMDRNGDGYVDFSDASRRPLARRKSDERLRKFVRHVDVDRDGRIGRDEFVHAPSRLFAVADADGDGVIDAAEARTLQDRASAFRR